VRLPCTHRLADVGEVYVVCVELRAASLLNDIIHRVFTSVEHRDMRALFVCPLSSVCHACNTHLTSSTARSFANKTFPSK
jgi:hypothetical protein